MCLEVAPAQVELETQSRPLGAQALHEFQGLRRGLRTADHDVHVRPGRGHRAPSRLHERHQALHAHRKTDRGRRVTPQLRDQAVVAAAGAYGILCTGGRGDPLEHRAVVVIEAAHQARVDLVAHAHAAQQATERIEVCVGLRIQMLGEQRRAANHLLHFRVLAVQDPQRVAGEAPFAVGVEPRCMRTQVLQQPRAIRAAAVRRAEGIDLQPQARDPQTPPQPRAERDELRIHIGARAADRFHVHLPELPVAAGLRRLVAEHRPQTPQLVTLSAQQAVGNQRAHDAGGGFGAQREAVATAVGEGIHFLADHVGVLADGALEELGVLNDWHANLFVAVGAEQLARARFEVLPGADLGRQHVVHSADGLDLLCHLNLHAPGAAAPVWCARRRR